MTITLHNSVDATTQTATATADGGWYYSFADLTKYVNDTLVTYSVTDHVDGFTTTGGTKDASDAYNLTNTIDQATIGISGTKAWAGVPATATLPAASDVTLTLFKTVNGNRSTVATTHPADNWTYSFTGLDKYDVGAGSTNTGAEIVYTVSDSMNGYTATDGTAANQYTVTNTFDQSYTSVSGEKTCASARRNSGGIGSDSL